MGLDRNNMMRNRIFILLCIFFSICTWASAVKNYRVQNISWSQLRCDTALNIKNIQDMKLMGNNELYVTYEIPNSYGDQLVNSLSVDLGKRNLSFKKEFFKRKNGTYVFSVPIIFWDHKGFMFAYERDNPHLYAVSGDTLKRNGQSIISSKSICPYRLVIEAKYPFVDSLGQYVFVGRQEKNGFQAILRSTPSTDGVRKIEEVSKIIFDSRYPSWLVNYGSLAYNPQKNVAAFAYQLFPAVQFYNLTDGSSFKFMKGRNTFNPKTLKEGDIWESNPIHFKAITANDKYIYCLYWGMTEQQAKNNQRRHSFAGQIVVLRWDGSVYKILTTRRKITSIAVSESGDYIIGYDEGRFFISTI